jgi:hypothetical protein
MIKKIIIILLAISVTSLFGCKKLEESGITIDKAITVLEYAKTAKKLINAGNANSMADELLKQIDTDKGTDEEETASDDESE